MPTKWEATTLSRARLRLDSLPCNVVSRIELFVPYSSADDIRVILSPFVSLKRALQSLDIPARSTEGNVSWTPVVQHANLTFMEEFA